MYSLKVERKFRAIIILSNISINNNYALVNTLPVSHKTYLKFLICKSKLIILIEMNKILI